MLPSPCNCGQPCRLSLSASPKCANFNLFFCAASEEERRRVGNGANSLFPRLANARDGELGKQGGGRRRSRGRHKFLPAVKSARK